MFEKYIVYIYFMPEWFALISLFLKNCVCALNSYLIQTQSVGRRTNPGCIITNWKFSRWFFQYQCTEKFILNFNIFKIKLMSRLTLTYSKFNFKFLPVQSTTEIAYSWNAGGAPTFWCHWILTRWHCKMIVDLGMSSKLKLLFFG